MKDHSPGGSHVSGSGENRKKRERVNGRRDQSLTVVGSRAGKYAAICSNKLSFTWLQSQDLRCRGIMVSAVK